MSASRPGRVALTFVVAAVTAGRAAHAQPAPSLVTFDWHAAEAPPALGPALAQVRRAEAAEVKADPEAAARRYLKALGKPMQGLREEDGGGDINRQLQLERTFSDQVGDTTVVFTQEYAEIPVYGSDVRVHLAREGGLQAVTSKMLPPPREVSTVASVSPQGAVDAARRHSEQPEKLRRLPVAAPKLFIYRHTDGKPYLTWVLTLPGVDGANPALWKYFVDAQKGTVLARHNDIKFQTAASGQGMGAHGQRKPLHTTELPAGGGFILEDSSLPQTRIKTYDFGFRDLQFDQGSLPGDTLLFAQNDWNQATHASAVDAHYFARAVFDYYWNVHNRNSLDDKGMDLVSSVRCTFWRQPGPGGDVKKWNNAAWVGKQMVYGEGDGVQFAPLTGALDVVAHEFTHGLTDSTAKLEYHDESGALNESYSDVFAAVIDSANWDIGEDVFTPATPGDALRSLENPARFGQPDHRKRYKVTSADNGGVHSNSGIPNKAAYLLAAGGTHEGVSVTPIGRDAMAQIYYLALTKYMSQLSDFDDARRQTVKACLDIYKTEPRKCRNVENAFAAVGIGAPVVP